MKNGVLRQNIALLCIICMGITSFQALAGITNSTNQTIQSQSTFGENEQIVKIMLSEPSTLGEVIDHDFSILEIY